jgi:hypothetical protein
MTMPFESEQQHVASSRRRLGAVSVSPRLLVVAVAVAAVAVVVVASSSSRRRHVVVAPSCRRRRRRRRIVSPSSSSSLSSRRRVVVVSTSSRRRLVVASSSGRRRIAGTPLVERVFANWRWQRSGGIHRVLDAICTPQRVAVHVCRGESPATLINYDALLYCVAIP